MFKIFKKKKQTQIQIDSSSKNLVIFPCEIIIDTFNGKETKTNIHQCIGYINELSFIKFLYPKASEPLFEYKLESISLDSKIAHSLFDGMIHEDGKCMIELKKI
jgi:hypothetical protein